MTSFVPVAATTPDRPATQPNPVSTRSPPDGSTPPAAAPPASTPTRRQALADHPTASLDTSMRTPAAASPPSSAVQPRDGRDESVSVQRLNAAKEAKEATTRTFVRRQENEAEEEVV